MRALSQAYRFLNLVSVDVACGAVVCGYFFARLFQVAPVPAGLYSLGLTVWIICSADHLMDAFPLRRDASTLRHRLHQRNFVPLVILLVAALIIDIVLILYIRKPVLKGGLVLAALVFLYLITHRYINPFKELMVSVLYAGGVLLPALSLHTNPVSFNLKLLVCSFVLTALLNLLLFSWFEWEQDVMDGRKSIATTIGKGYTGRLIWILYFLNSVILAVILKEGFYQFESLIIMGMDAVLMTILLFEERFRKGDLYRLLGDSIFLIPLIGLL